jgi:hypothetical protein
VLIVARAQRAENDVTLREAGATAVVVPEIAGSLMLLEESLMLLGLPHNHILTAISPLALLSNTSEQERADTKSLSQTDGAISRGTEFSL